MVCILYDVAKNPYIYTTCTQKPENRCFAGQHAAFFGYHANTYGLYRCTGKNEVLPFFRENACSNRKPAVRLDSNITTDASAVYIDVVAITDVIDFLILVEMLAKAGTGQRLEHIVLAPKLVGGIKILGACFCFREEVDIPLRLHEIHHVVSIGNGGVHVCLGLLADRKLVVLLNQALQTVETPKKQAFRVCSQLFREIGMA